MSVFVPRESLFNVTPVRRPFISLCFVFIGCFQMQRGVSRRAFRSKCFFVDETKRDTDENCGKKPWELSSLRKEEHAYALRRTFCDFSRVSGEKKKSERGRSAFYGSRLCVHARLASACIMHATKLNNTALERRVLTLQYIAFMGHYARAANGLIYGSRRNRLFASVMFALFRYLQNQFLRNKNTETYATRWINSRNKLQ